MDMISARLGVDIDGTFTGVFLKIGVAGKGQGVIRGYVSPEAAKIVYGYSYDT